MRFKKFFICLLMFLFASLSYPALAYASSNLTLTLVANDNDGAGVSDFGHSFLIISNNSSSSINLSGYTLKSGKQLTLGVRGGAPWISNYSGSYFNIEAYQADVYKQFSYFTIDVTKKDLDTVVNYFIKNSGEYDVLTHNCTTVATKAWNKVCPLLYIVADTSVPNDLRTMLNLFPGHGSGTSLTGCGLLDSSADETEVFYLDTSGGIIPGQLGGTVSKSTTKWTTTGTTITVTWSKYTKSKYATGYYIGYKESTSTGDYTYKKVNSIDTTSCKLTGLKNGTKYKVVVYAAFDYSMDVGSGTITTENCLQKSVYTNSITLDKTSVSLAKGTTTSLSATTKGYTKYAVKWSSSNKKVAKVSKTGKITAVGKGTATITAQYSNCKATCKVTVTNPTISLNKLTITLYPGQTFKLKATVNGAKKTVTWKSSNSSVVSVNSNGKITAKKAGKNIKIKAKANGVTATCKVTVKNPSIKLDQSTAEIAVGDTLSLKATVEGTDNTVTWKSSNKSVATVSSSGKVSGIKKGTATITATANGVSASCVITIVKKPAALSQIDLTAYLGMDVDEGLKQLATDCGGTNTELYQKAIACFAGGLSGNAFVNGTIAEANLNQSVSNDGIYSGDQTVTIAGLYKGISVSDANAIIQENGWTLSNTISQYGMYYYRYYTKGNITILLETMVASGETFGPYIYCAYSGYEKLITP
ncbi:MAG: Ig-like domain-containing protein [Clostridiales bacterium]|nr:Ig-like domain-containing protein [Clostridiales bacterium]